MGLSASRSFQAYNSGMPRVMWKRTGVLVTLCAGLILFLVVFVLPFVWLVRMGWARGCTIAGMWMFPDDPDDDDDDEDLPVG
jgi:hypothetical protein